MVLCIDSLLKNEFMQHNKFYFQPKKKKTSFSIFRIPISSNFFGKMHNKKGFINLGNNINLDILVKFMF